MATFGFFPGETLSEVDVPQGYASAVVRAGTLEETVFCSLSTWSMADYLIHWRQTAERCLQSSQPGLLCTDLNPDSAGLFAAFPEGDAYRLEEWIVKRSSVRLDGHFIAMKSMGPTPGKGVSSWRVERAEIEAFCGRVTRSANHA